MERTQEQIQQHVAEKAKYAASVAVASGNVAKDAFVSVTKVSLIALALMGWSLYPNHLDAQEPTRRQAQDGQMTNQDAVKIAQAYPDNCEVPNVPLKGTELHYYPPFSPTASVFDTWCEIQSLRASEPIKVWLVTKEESTPLVKSNFPLDGTVHSTKKMFAYDLANAIQHGGGVNLRRALRTLSSLGFPQDSPEGPYQFFNGDLQMEVKGVEIMGLTFAVTVYFEPNVALVPKHFSQTADYLHMRMPGSPLKVSNPRNS